MGTVYQTGKKPEHSGVIAIEFIGEKGVEMSSRAYTLVDARAVYNAMRERYPEHDGKLLHVRILDGQELTPHDRKRLYAKGLAGKPPIVDGGFVREVTGLTPSLTFSVQDPSGGSAIIEVGDDASWLPKAAALLQAFVGEAAWEPAEPLETWVPG